MHIKKILLVLIIVSSCTSNSNQIKFHKSHEVSRIDKPFSDVVETENLLFLTGQIGKNHKTGQLVDGGIKAETQQTIENIKSVLEHHNSSLDRVVKCTVILKHIEDFKAFNEIYVSYFKNKPARTTFAASNLAANALIEIDVIASK